LSRPSLAEAAQISSTARVLAAADEVIELLANLVSSMSAIDAVDGSSTGTGVPSTGLLKAPTIRRSQACKRLRQSAKCRIFSFGPQVCPLLEVKWTFLNSSPCPLLTHSGHDAPPVWRRYEVGYDLFGINGKTGPSVPAANIKPR
jgi:hypothetical protein